MECNLLVAVNWLLAPSFLPLTRRSCPKGAFNNYVDKMKGGGGGQKMSVFAHTQGIKSVHAGAGGSNNNKILSMLLLNAPKAEGRSKNPWGACSNGVGITCPPG